MSKKHQAKGKVRVELSPNEASYVQGMLAAYKQRLELDKSTGGAFITQEIKKAERVERKFLTA